MKLSLLKNSQTRGNPQTSVMTDRRQSNDNQAEEATVGLSSDLNFAAAYFLSRSCKKHREQSKDERAKRKFEEAVERLFQQDEESGPAETI
ncbi:hypothetical protein BDV25DRAFT_137931 [Aspergillus avenaceus]|uniref:Uncharacterized protein n=1 Tax=Aspergillus avenaceus TaxID=36643 RepID=A0A5N6U141_ASPAV|nr:hypothetical protein BDV25DRAFT_137931 [Aspergillus avenaceus]